LAWRHVEARLLSWHRLRSWLRLERKYRVDGHTPNASLAKTIISSRWCNCLDETQVDSVDAADLCRMRAASDYEVVQDPGLEALP
jgi:hypothetical protein